jgi:diguanylate cyclase (GGDEF)-like protein
MADVSASGAGFLPHGYCFLWQPGLLWLHVASDAIIAIAYFSIPATLVYLMRNRVATSYNWVLALFGAFIVLCGSTHVLDIVDVWTPAYWIAGYVKAATALVSIATVVMLVPVLPRLIRIPNPGTDALTQLPNRLTFVENLERALARANRAEETCAVLYIDLDNFKRVNDSFGHAAGDALLVAVAERLKHAVRLGDVVGRMSGDEFVVLLDPVGSPEFAQRTAERISAELGEPFPLGGAMRSVGASVGVAFSAGPGASETADALIASADRAMYRVKAIRREPISRPHYVASDRGSANLS